MYFPNGQWHKPFRASEFYTRKDLGSNPTTNKLLKFFSNRFRILSGLLSNYF